MMDSKNTIIDPIYFNVWWEAIQKGYDAKTLLYSIGPDQLESKKHLFKLLTTPLPGKREYCPATELYYRKDLHIQIYGGWFGYPLIDMLVDTFSNISRITNIDIDSKALDLCRKFTFEKNLSDIVFFKESDVCKWRHHKDKDVRLVINTSSEHMPNLPELIKNKTYDKKCIFALQSNNMFHVVDQHTNCSNSLNEFVQKTGLTKIFVADTYKMQNGYERYTVIGNHE